MWYEEKSVKCGLQEAGCPILIMRLLKQFCHFLLNGSQLGSIQLHQQVGVSAHHQACGPPSKEISSFLWSVKDDLGLKMPGVHRSKEVTEIELYPNRMNFCLSTSWKPLIDSLKDNSRPSSHGSRSGFSAG
jgi:hypothetical protein